jgi:hypothetical protein
MKISGMSFRTLAASVAAVVIASGVGGSAAFATQPTNTNPDAVAAPLRAASYVDPTNGPSAEALYPEGVLQSIGAIKLRGGKITCHAGMVKVPLRLGRDLADSHMTINHSLVVNKVTSMGWYIETPDDQLNRLVTVLVVNNNSAVEVPPVFDSRPSTSYMLSLADWGPITSVFGCVNIPL